MRKSKKRMALKSIGKIQSYESDVVSLIMREIEERELEEQYRIIRNIQNLLSIELAKIIRRGVDWRKV